MIHKWDGRNASLRYPGARGKVTYGGRLTDIRVRIAEAHLSGWGRGDYEVKVRVGKPPAEQQWVKVHMDDDLAERIIRRAHFAARTGDAHVEATAGTA